MIFQLKKNKFIWGVFISLLVAASVDALYMTGTLKGLEAKSYDLRAKIVRKDVKPHEDIALVLIDEASLKAMNPLVGRWPWPRSIYLDLLDYLVMGGARTVVFDIIFPEYERALAANGEIGPNDAMLVEATAMAGNVYHAAQIIKDVEDEINKNLLDNPMPEDFVEMFSLRNLKKSGFEATAYNNFYLPFRELYEVSKGVGVVEFAADPDGIYRRTKLFRHYRGDFYPVISMAVLLDELKPENIIKEDGRIVMDTIDIPVLDDGQYLINMYKNFNTYSISGILSSIQQIHQGEMEGLMVQPEEFENKIVIIGASAVGVEDLKPTAMATRMPGVMLHASLISNVLQKDFLKVVPKKQTRLIIYVGALFLGLLILSFRQLFFQMLLPVGAALIYIVACFWGFRENIVLDFVPPLVSIVGVWIGSFSYLYFSEGKEKRKVRKMLGQYVSPAVLTELVDRGGDYIKAEVGSKERLTILFSDIRGFTTLSESMEAEKVVEILNSYLSSMVDVIFNNKGTLDKFIGDAIMAFWGAPVMVADHAKRSVRAAVEMTRGLHSLNKDFVQKGYPELQVGIGVHTGEVILGNIGSEKKLDYTVIGDHVNLTSRLEGLTKLYGCDVLISKSTYDELDGEFPCRIVDNVRVKGKDEPIKIYTVLGLSDDPDKDIARKRKLAKYSEVAFDHYLNRDFEKSMQMFTKLVAFSNDDKISQQFIQRCREYIKAAPPEDWDGVFTMTTK